MRLKLGKEVALFDDLASIRGRIRLLQRLNYAIYANGMLTNPASRVGRISLYQQSLRTAIYLDPGGGNLANEI